ncbi:DUF2855 family protein [Streptomyces sp. Z26]|uniref:DUF2855 family protein n=1 Tax=Streptomyces sp. Z26 TaxID=2500177 RepID=UPI000EF15FCC|nr:DUF2855 family protein [Streptomyces sp. Z26]RLL68209.1 DUF2855 family protein [Streptomyces sp. Z26]
MDTSAPRDAEAWRLLVSRDDLATTRTDTGPVPEVGPGEALLRVDRVGLTANNVTYAALGDPFRYWEFFPAPDGWGNVPLWGFADVVASAADGVAPGDRFYGYLPSGSHLLVRPDRVGPFGFRDVSPHRVELPSPYNRYARTTGDPGYAADREDVQALYRPLFWTSFLLADWLVDQELCGARDVVLSSASSKTAYGTAFELRAHRERRTGGAGGPDGPGGYGVVGLTSARNRAFTESLGCYDRVLTYDETALLSPERPVVYADFAGDRRLAATLAERLGGALTCHATVGVTHQEAAPAGSLAEAGAGTGSRGDEDGAADTGAGGDGHGRAMFFAPVQMRKRVGDWGREGLEERFGAAWQRFGAAVGSWVDVVHDEGREGLERVWRDVLSGHDAPRTGHVLTL